MTVRSALYGLLAAVALAAAVLSFAALRDLALLCGFSTRLAWLLPVVVDAGAAAGSLVWLGGHGDIRAQQFARWLALVLLASSVAANAVSHGLEAYGARPAWWLVVLVSGVAPGVLGAVVHLAVLVGRASRTVGSPAASTQAARTVESREQEVESPGAAPVLIPVAEVAAMTRVMQSAQVTTVSSHPPAEPENTGDDVADVATEPEETWEAKRDRLLRSRAGRKQLSRELEVSEWEARQIQESWRRSQESGEATG